MAGLTAATKGEIGDFLVKEGSRFIEERAAEPDQTELKPFHSRLMPLPFEAWSRWSERSFSTRSGGWFQHIALIVAREFHPRAELNYLVSGDIRNAAAAHIEELIALMSLKVGRRVPNRSLDIQQVMSVQGPGGSPRTAVSDLFVQRRDGLEMYFEIKTPSPNKGQCIEMKTRMLVITALRHGAKVEARSATAYNPFGEEADYRSHCSGWVRQFLDIGNDFLIGRDFWTAIGDEQTYGDLLAVAAEAGQTLTPLFEKYALDESDDGQ